MTLKFKTIKDGGQLNKIYWEELLTRAHWAAITSIYRNTKWTQGILQSDKNLNFLACSSCLRALIESSGDSMTSLSVIPKGLAEHFRNIKECVSGNMKDKVCTAPELESNLIHFVYAQSVTQKDKKEHGIPDNHIARFNSDYISILDHNKKDGPIYNLYKILCQITHPAALSVLYGMSERSESDVTQLKFIDNPDKKAIDALLEAYETEIATVCQYGYNNCLILIENPKPL